MSENKWRHLKLTLAAGWLLFTMSFAGWWMFLGLNYLEHVQGQLHQAPQFLAKYRRMMLWEGGAWMILLLAGGATLIFLIAREGRRARELKEFFAAFSHEIKTSLASLRLQAESLMEDQKNDNPIYNRLVADTVRLEMQLQNSLFLSSDADIKLFIEELSLKKVVRGLQLQWPQLKIKLSGDCIIRSDERAITSVLSNLVQNALVHGKATEFILRPTRVSAQYIRLDFVDNGIGFSGNPQNLGRMFLRHTAKSGSGVGLYVCRGLIKKQNGKLEFLKQSARGFGGQIELQGNLA